MSAEACPDTTVHYCLTCGPVMQEVYPQGTMTFHQPVEHPDYLTFQEEDNPQ